ncbi:hypothetical protein WR25_10380 [Diploscapter pachys]|uniref:SXP/RAL-2 family protein Ani s 5-like cation-binding domain-containing protein n=1 Tax=Diploscapter pachys TaxID=2018661 RepID=A0A2A2KZ79_9BILA|nr:hypothetical protein WR25_10380 [Diploscapter pachys]
MKTLSGYILLLLLPLLAVSIRTDASSGLLEKLRVRRGVTEEVMDKYYSTVYDLNLSADQKWDILQKLPPIYQTSLKNQAKLAWESVSLYFMQNPSILVHMQSNQLVSKIKELKASKVGTMTKADEESNNEIVRKFQNKMKTEGLCVAC